MVGQSYTSSTFQLFLNNFLIGEQKPLPIANARYAVKGMHQRDTFLVNASSINAASGVLDAKYQFIPGSGFSQGYLDFLLINFTRKLALVNNQTIFTSGKSLSNPISEFKVSSVNENTTVWEITDPANTRSQSFRLNSGIATFSITTDNLNKFIVFNSDIPSPTPAVRISNQDLHALSTPNLIIVTHPLFKDEAQRLADHRESFSNWKVNVVTTYEVYNEFSSGRQDVSAVRDFVKFLYDKNPSTLKALLLFGKCSYDYKDRKPNNTNYVITYESRNSLHPLQTYSSDDYFAFLEDDEGDWFESPARNHTLDIGVGRLPVKNVEEAKNVVDEIIAYDTGKERFGYWRKEIVFVADDGSNSDGFTSLHQYQADQLAQYIETSNPAFDTKKLFLGTYEKVVKPSGESVPKMTEDIVRSFDKGSLIINFTGHGSERVWMDEVVFSTQIIGELKNKLTPFMVTATCEFGRHDDPVITSGAEVSVLLKDAGVIGTVTSTRPVNASTNFQLNMAFYEALFQKESDDYLPVGEVFRRMKNNSTSGVSNRNFSLLGDPSLTLSLPSNKVVVRELNTSSGSDTLKALSTVVVRGEIHNGNGEKISNFIGTLEATLFDKEFDFTTIGRNNPPFTYKQWYNALFRGKASVKNGDFAMQFVLPKNIAYQIAEGKFSLYASDPSQNIDANGVYFDFKIGGSETQMVSESNSPEISVFIGDTTFVNGGIALPNTNLIVNLRDDTGINISSYGIGNNLMATLDDDENIFILNDYYSANTDDNTSGWANYPLKNLEPGRHTMRIKAWDVFNNTAEASIDFIITDEEALVIESFGNYPNPFSDRTTLFFTHNRSGDGLLIDMAIYHPTGQLIARHSKTADQSNYKVELSFLDEVTGLSPGLYLAQLKVRSSNGMLASRSMKIVKR